MGRDRMWRLSWVGTHPHSTHLVGSLRLRLSPDASPQQLVSTFRLPSGVGATCVLKSPTNGSLGPTLNLSSGESRLLAARFFDSMCLESFTQGLPLSNFVPPPPSPAPSDSPVSPDEDPLQAWNASLLPTSGPGTGWQGHLGSWGSEDRANCAFSAHRELDIGTLPATPGAGARPLHLFCTGHWLLLPGWCGRAPAPDAGGHG